MLCNTARHDCTMHMPCHAGQDAWSTGVDMHLTSAYLSIHQYHNLPNRKHILGNCAGELTYPRGDSPFRPSWLRAPFYATAVRDARGAGIGQSGGIPESATGGKQASACF